MLRTPGPGRRLGRGTGWNVVYCPKRLGGNQGEGSDADRSFVLEAQRGKDSRCFTGYRCGRGKA
jgi:hypothetical protein